MIFIYPVYMFVDFILFIADLLTKKNTGASIIILSLGVNIICLPVYNIAEKLQEKERSVQEKMKNMVKRIKAVFKGDEQYMMLSAYYKESGYHPLYALRSVFPLFIQIPFFMAAYSILSSLPAMKFTQFLFFNDLSLPDGLLKISSLSINIMPIIMTLVNIVASAVYANNRQFKEKIQLYAVALIFFALLYNSPSGLVFYWTLNNIFSLIKNICYKIKLKRKTWYVITVVTLAVFTIVVTVLMRPTRYGHRTPTAIMLLLTLLTASFPLIKKILLHLEPKNGSIIFDNAKNRFKIFITACAALTIFIGLSLPASVISSSPQEFSNFEGFTNPLGILYYSFTQSLGCFIWLLCIYKLLSASAQKYFTKGIVILLICTLINVFLFGGSYGSIKNNLTFENSDMLKSGVKYFLLNILVLAAGIIFTSAFLYSRFSRFTLSLTGILLFSFSAAAGISAVSIQREYAHFKNTNSVLTKKDEQKAYRISKNGKNIFVFMLDRASNVFIEPIFDNSTKVKDSYTGFTLFENVLSFAGHTNVSTPSLFGGYEYTPENINKRSEELLVDKHNEALSVLPRLFSENNWNVSFTDPSWLNYSWCPDLTVFKNYNMIAQNTEYKYGKFLNTGHKVLDEENKAQAEAAKERGGGGVRRNMLYFSFFKILPAEVRRVFYSSGRGYYADNIDRGITREFFVRAYNALLSMQDEVNFIESGNCLNLIVNNTTHEPIDKNDIRKLKKEFLIPIAKKYCLNSDTEAHFYVNYLTHEKLAEFFSFLKENGCYDNSRIIIVSDHGWSSLKLSTMTWLKQFEESDINTLTVQKFLPLMMVKDFYSSGSLKKDNTFMTLADTPILVTEGLSQEFMKNPFSGKTFKESQDKKLVKIMISVDWDAAKQKNLTQFLKTQDLWAYVHDNIFNPNNWSWARTKND